MIIDYASNFISDLANPENKIELFYLSLDNSRTVKCSTDILNEGYYLIEVSQFTLNHNITLSGIRFSLYNKIHLYYKLNDEPELKIAASIPIIQNGNQVIIDYARNILHLDLRFKVVNAQIKLVKFNQDSTKRITYPVILNHKHDLSDNSSTTPSAVDTIEKFDAVKDINTRVKYESDSPIIYSDNSSVYKRDDVTGEVESLIDRTTPRPITNSTQDIYKFSNGLLTLFGINVDSIVKSTGIDYKSLSLKDYYLLATSDNLLLFNYPTSIEVEHNSSVGTTDYTFTINIENKASAVSTELIANNSLVSISKLAESENQISYMLSFTNDDTDTFGMLSLRVSDINSSIVKTINWKNNYKG